MISSQDILDALARSKNGVEIIDSLIEHPLRGMILLNTFVSGLEVQAEIEADAHDALVKLVEGN